MILKVLGAGRGKILRIFITEYAALGVIAGLFGLGAGALAAFAVCRYVMDIEFDFAAAPALAMTAVAVGMTIALGLAASWRILGRKPAAYLRAA